MSTDADSVSRSDSPDRGTPGNTDGRLETENARLRAELDSQVTYQRAARIFVAVGVAFLIATLVFPGAQGVLVALAGTAVFGAILLWTLSSEPVVSSVVTEAVTDARSQNLAEVTRALDLEGHVTYVPVATEGVHMCVSPPDGERLNGVLNPPSVTSKDCDGLMLEPTGRRLIAVLQARTGGLPQDVSSAVPVLVEAVTEAFELAASVETQLSGGTDGSPPSRVTAQVKGSEFGNPADVDHPIPSLIGVGLASVTGRPVEARVTTNDGKTTTISFEFRNDGST